MKLTWKDDGLLIAGSAYFLVVFSLAIYYKSWLIVLIGFTFLI